MKNAVFVGLDGKEGYVALSIIVLKRFIQLNPTYDAYVIGVSFTDKSIELLNEYGIKYKVYNRLEDWFTPSYIKWCEICIKWGLVSTYHNLSYDSYIDNVMVANYIHFYAYELLSDYDYVMCLSADIWPHTKFDVDFSSIKYTAGTVSLNGPDTAMSMRSWICHQRRAGYDFHGHGVRLGRSDEEQEEFIRILNLEFPNLDWDAKRLLNGCPVYNVKNCREIDLYCSINEFFKKLIELSFKYDFPSLVQKQDDSLMVFYKCIYPEYFTELDPNVCITYQRDVLSADSIQHYHFLKGAIKPWLGDKLQDRRVYPVPAGPLPEEYSLARQLQCEYIDYVHNNFDIDFIEEYLPEMYYTSSTLKILRENYEKNIRTRE